MSSTLTLDQAYPQFTTSHYLVQFKDRKVAIVPSNKVSFPPRLRPSYICTVCCPGRRLSEAVVLGSGSRESLEEQIKSTFQTPVRPKKKVTFKPPKPLKRKADSSFSKSPGKKLRREGPGASDTAESSGSLGGADSWYTVPQQDGNWYLNETLRGDEDTESLISQPTLLSEWYIEESSEVSSTIVLSA